MENQAQRSFRMETETEREVEEKKLIENRLTSISAEVSLILAIYLLKYAQPTDGRNILPANQLKCQVISECLVSFFDFKRK